MRRSIFMALVVGASLVLAACGSATDNLVGKDWQLVAITEKVPAFQGVVPPDQVGKFTINFAKDGTYTGTADCNQMAGSYTTGSSNAMTITPGPMTLMFCGEGSYDVLFVHALERVESYAVANDQLTLGLKDGGQLEFSLPGATSSQAAATATATASPTPKPTASPSPTPSPTPKPTATPTPKPSATATAKPSGSANPTTAPTATPKPTAQPTPKPTPTPTPAQGLLGKTWQLTSITTREPSFQGNVPADQQAKYTVTFAQDGTFQATADCNTVTGQYTTGDPNSASGNLTITPGPGTLVYCGDGTLSDLYVLALSNAASYAVANGQLTITLADNGTLVYK